MLYIKNHIMVLNSIGISLMEKNILDLIRVYILKSKGNLFMKQVLKYQQVKQ